MERLSALDAAFLEAEDADRHTSMAIASIAVFDGPVPPQDELTEAYASRLPLVPRYCQVVRRAPFDLAAPVWVDDPDFDIGYHVRRTALPAPGGTAELYALMARLMAQRLDRERPLWETWVIEGLRDGQWALVSKVHHCMVDGVAGTELYHLLLSTSPDPLATPAVAPLPPPKPGPSPLRLLAGGALQLVAMPWRDAALVVSALRRPVRSWQRVVTTAQGLLALSGSVVPTAPSSLIGGIGQHRRYDATSVPLADVKRIAHHFGVSVNDVALAALSGGYRALLLARDDECHPRSVRTLVPASVRPPGAEGDLANQVSCLLTDLPVHLDDPVARLHAVHRDLRRAKEQHEAEAGEALVELTGAQPFAVVAPVLRALFRMPQHNLVTVTTNVPGPQVPLYLLGRKLGRLLPFVPIADRVRVGVAMLSYCDEFAFGVTADYDNGKHIDVLLDATRRDLAALGSAVAGTDPVAQTG